MTVEEDKKLKDIETRVMAFMLYKGIIGEENAVNEDEMIAMMEKEGWLDITPQQIQSLLRNKNIIDEEEEQ